MEDFLEIKVKALCVRTEDYKENDKILTLISLEKGKIIASAKSVKKITSKLKMSCSPLCFGEFILFEKAGRYTVIGCSVEDNFLLCWSDINKYSSSQIVLETLNKITKEEMPCENELKLALVTLSYINLESASPFIFSLWFLIKLFAILGIDIDGQNTIPEKSRILLKSISTMEPSDLGALDITSGTLYKLFVLIGYIYSEDFSININSLKEAMKLI